MEEQTHTPVKIEILMAQNAVYGGAWVLHFLLFLYSVLFFTDPKRSRAVWLQTLRMASALALFALSFVQRFDLAYFTSYSDPTITVPFWYWVITAITFALVGFEHAYEFHQSQGFALYHGFVAASFAGWLALAMIKTEIFIASAVFASVFGLLYLVNAIIVIARILRAKFSRKQKSTDIFLFLAVAIVPLVYIIPWSLEPSVSNKATNDNTMIGYLILDCVTRIVAPAILWILHDRAPVKVEVTISKETETLVVGGSQAAAAKSTKAAFSNALFKTA